MALLRISKERLTSYLKRNRRKKFFMGAATECLGASLLEELHPGKDRSYSWGCFSGQWISSDGVVHGYDGPKWLGRFIGKAIRSGTSPITGEELLRRFQAK